MKILEVTPFFSPVHGGSAEVPYQLSKELARRKHQIIIYTSDYNLGREYINLIPEITVRSFKTWSSWVKFYITPGMVARVKKDINSFDIVHLHNFRTFQNMVVHYYACKHGIPYVLQTHGSLPRIVSRQMLKQIFDSMWGYRLLRDASRVIAVTELEAEQCKSMGVAGDKIDIIPHGIDLAEFAHLPKRRGFRKAYGIGSNDKVILWLGRIDRTKGLDILAQAFTGLTQALPDVRLVIAGPDDGYLPALKVLIKELGIDNRVLFTGPLYGQDKLKAYIDADVFVLPSSYEIFGLTVLEALACGTPVVVTDRCGVAEAIKERAGLVVPYDKEQVRIALLQMLEDDRLRQEFGEKGKLLVREEFNWEKVAEQVERVYEGTRT